MILLLLLTVLAATAINGQFEYKFNSEAKSWPDAQKECIKWGGNLATIFGKMHNHHFKMVLGMRKMTSAWIGLSDNREEGKFRWASMVPNGYTNWGIKPNGGKSENCVEMLAGSGKWNDKSCDTELPFICERTLFEYKFVCESLSWSDAEEECEKWKGGNLVAIRAPIQNDYFTYELMKRGWSSAWLGFSDSAQEGTFKWINPVMTMGYTNWQVKPNGGEKENCAGIISGGKWNDYSCDAKMPSICETRRLEYKIDDTGKSWADAQEACEEWGGNLITINSEIQNNYIKAELKSRTVESSWIGLSDSAKEGAFTWITSPERSRYTNWQQEPSGGTDENCVELTEGNGKWNDASCATKKPFTCQRYKMMDRMMMEMEMMEMHR